jgi:N4-gp56 family major capsid protein
MGNGTANSQLSVEMKEFYDKTLIEMAGPELIHDQFAQKRPIPAGNGKVIEFRQFASYEPVTTPLKEGVEPASTELSATSIKATVEQYGAFTKITDVLELTAIDNVLAEATKLHGRQAGITLDKITRNAMQATTREYFCPSAAAPTTEITTRAGLKDDSVLTVDVLMQVVALLRASNAPTINGKYIAICHPYTCYDLMTDPLWISVHQYKNPENIYNGEVGEIAGVRIIQSSIAKIYEGGVFGTLVFGDGAYGVTEITGGGLKHIFKSKEQAGGALEQYSTTGWKAARCAEVLIPEYLIRVESKSPKFSKNLAEN